MSGLTLDLPGKHLFVRGTGPEGIRIGDLTYQRSLLLSAAEVRADWPPQHFDELDEPHLQAVLGMEPQLVVLGTGHRQRFLTPPLQGLFYARGVGIEVMTTEAACRTFNVLVGEGRVVVAALLPLDA